MYRDLRAFLEVAAGKGGARERSPRIDSRRQPMRIILIKRVLSPAVADILSLVSSATARLKMVAIYMFKAYVVIQCPCDR
jgi:hypothetical protein